LNKLGKYNVNAGINATSKSTITLTSKNGNNSLVAVPIDTFPICEATKRHTPTGGVTTPIIIANTIVTPKCIGSIPIDVATGNNTGNKITKPAIVSINVPTKRTNANINKITIYLFVEIPKMTSATICGICSLIKIQPKRFANPTNNIIDAVVVIVFNIILGISITGNSL